ncbi:hypothetical protein FRC04_008652 [Tulasnella sp. 424]|nr:hypothetical protein FRC04_008652 [Tulasnella sp. 424]KAG8958831.1 hypothetical protein FRC05_008614 [Tulasnella sp. 425]
MMSQAQNQFAALAKAATAKRKAGAGVSDADLLSSAAGVGASGGNRRPLIAPSSPSMKSPTRKKAKPSDDRTSQIPTSLPTPATAPRSSNPSRAPTKAGTAKKNQAPTSSIAFGTRVPAKTPIPQQGTSSRTLGGPTSAKELPELGDPFEEGAATFSTGGTITPELGQGLADLNLSRDEDYDPNIDPALYNETPLGKRRNQHTRDFMDITPRAPTARSTKNDLDVLAQVLGILQGIQTSVKDDKKDRKKLQSSLDSMSERLTKLEDVANTTLMEVRELKEAHEVAIKEIKESCRSTRFEGATSGANNEDISAEEFMTKLVKTYRSAFLEAMLIPDAKDLPDHLTPDDILENPGSTTYRLVKSNEGGGSTSALRPDFTRAFGQQKDWHQSIFDIVKHGGSRFGDLTGAALSTATAKMHKEALGRCFRSLKASYKTQHKPDDERADQLQAQRHRARRTTLAGSRRDIRTTASSSLPEVLLAPEWDFMFDYGYTSDQLSIDEPTRSRFPDAVEKLGPNEKFDVIISPAFQSPAVTRIKHELIDKMIKEQEDADSASRTKPKKGNKKTPTVYDNFLSDRPLPKGPIPYFALSQAHVVENPNDFSTAINPNLELDQDDIDELAENGVIPEARDREERTRIYTESLDLLRLWAVDSPEGQLRNIQRLAEAEGEGMQMMDDSEPYDASGDEDDFY